MLYVRMVTILRIRNIYVWNAENTTEVATSCIKIYKISEEKYWQFHRVNNRSIYIHSAGYIVRLATHNYTTREYSCYAWDNIRWELEPAISARRWMRIMRFTIEKSLRARDSTLLQFNTRVRVKRKREIRWIVTSCNMYCNLVWRAFGVSSICTANIWRALHLFRCTYLRYSELPARCIDMHVDKALTI